MLIILISCLTCTSTANGPEADVLTRALCDSYPSEQENVSAQIFCNSISHPASLVLVTSKTSMSDEKNARDDVRLFERFTPSTKTDRIKDSME